MDVIFCDMELQLIKHNDILFRDILRAVSVKSVAWPHPVESQLKWIIDNMYPNDIHVFLTDGEADKAYMTLSPVEGLMNAILCKCLHNTAYVKSNIMSSFTKAA